MTAVQEKREVVKSQRLAGKVALVTGGSRGIGAAIALRLAGEGATVAVNYTKDKDSAEKVVNQITKLGSKATAFKGNVASQSEMNTLVDDVVKAYGGIDILVNNAGVFEMAPVDQITVEHFQRLFDVNVKGVIATTVAALKKMRNGGRVISVSSGAAKQTIAGGSVYSSTKAALETLTRVWAQELGARKITVNAVAPGTTATDMLNAGLDEATKQHMVTKTALGRLGEPEDIADVVAFLASEDGRWVTGHTIACDGGLSV